MSTLEKEMASRSSILAWRVLWTEPAGLPSMGSQSRTWLKQLSMHAGIGEGNGNPLQCSCLESPRDRGAWWTSIYGVTQSRTQLTWLSSNISVDIQDLQQDILKAFNKHLNVISGSDFLDTVADNLPSLNPLKQIKTFGCWIVLVMGVILIMCLRFCLVWRRTIKRQQSQQQQLAFLAISRHVQNQKGRDDVRDRKSKNKAGPSQGCKRNW